ncbi:MAG: peptidoglycan binding protein CsiV [Gammaproteobacteria bacterium]|nr:peptidoglycan binding protein CsiV [Gammaproteobacteria bacterium]
MVYRLTTSILLLWLVFCSAAAQEVATERYTVEIIIFQHSDQSRNTPETPAASSMIPDSALELQLDASRSLTDGTLSGMNEYAARPPIAFHLLALKPEYPAVVKIDTKNGQLNRTYARLQRVDAYEPVVHTAWIHLAQSSELAQPYTINAALPDTGEITGSVTLYKERFVHLELDLSLTIPAAMQVTDSLQTTESRLQVEAIFETGTAQENGDEKRMPAMIVSQDSQYQLQESRRVRNGQLHYFDHPQFGVIAVVQVIETQPDKANSISSLN